MPKKHIIIASGGTGGHIFPAQAFANCLASEDESFDITFVTNKASANFQQQNPKITYKSVIAAPFSGKNFTSKLMSLCRLGFGVLQMLGRFIIHRPLVAVGFGSYASVPVLLAARLLGVPYVVHEQNSVMGLANRKLARHASLVALTFADTRFLPEGVSTKVVGNPVRQEFVRKAYRASTGDQEFRVVITGGSQGARFFGEQIPLAFASMPKAYRKRLRITQQVRAEQLEATREIYQRAGIDVELSSFLRDMPELLASSHLLIGRAGASTIAEAVAVGRPIILIPLPDSVDSHQLINAQSVSDSGGAWMFAQDSTEASFLAKRICDCMDNSKVLRVAAQNIGNFFAISADKRLYSELLVLLGSDEV